MMTKFGQCKLCLEIRPLRESHVIPELAYKPLYDDKHRFLDLDGATGTYSIPQKGFREPLLCQECEAIFQRSEDYFARYWYQRDPLPNPVHDVYVERTGFDFEPFYRFHLSILWRASVAQSARFSAVTLGPFEEPFRQFLLGLAASLQVEFSVYGMVLRHPRTHELSPIMSAPTRSRFNGVTTYTFVFGSCSWYYCVSKQPPPFAESLRLKRPGKIIMPVIDYTAEGSITRAWGKWRKTPKWKDAFEQMRGK